MMLSVDLERARAACVDSIESFVRAVDHFPEIELYGASRCLGWSRVDVVAHVVGGWQEMFAGIVSVADSGPTVDAASYWPAFADDYSGEDPVLVLAAQRRRAAAFARPSSAVAQLKDVADSLVRGVRGLDDRPRSWQGHVFTAGDFLAIWAVEDVIHHLDLASESAAPPTALALARSTVEALLGEPLPQDWSDEDAVLIGTGRIAPPPEVGRLAEALPVLR